MRIGVMGAAGGVGAVIARTVAAEKDVEEVFAADIDQARMERIAQRIGSPKLKAERLDLKDMGAVDKFLKHCDVVVNSTWDDFNKPITDAVFKAGVDLVDLTSSQSGTEFLQLRRIDDAKRAGVRILLELGVAPGITNFLAVASANTLDKVDTVKIRLGRRPLPNPRALFSFTVRGILEEWTWQAPVLHNGKLELRDPLSQKETIEFPEPIGKRDVYLTPHEEPIMLARSLASKGVREVDYYMPHHYDLWSAFRKVEMLSDKPFRYRGIEFSPLEFLQSYLAQFQTNIVGDEQPIVDEACVWTEVVGDRGGKRRRLRRWCIARARPEWRAATTHIATGTPAALGALALGRGQVKEPGIYCPEEVLPAEPFLEELGRRGFEFHFEDVAFKGKAAGA